MTITNADIAHWICYTLLPYYAGYFVHAIKCKYKVSKEKEADYELRLNKIMTGDIMENIKRNIVDLQDIAAKYERISKNTLELLDQKIMVVRTIRGIK